LHGRFAVVDALDADIDPTVDRLETVHVLEERARHPTERLPVPFGNDDRQSIRRILSVQTKVEPVAWLKSNRSLLRTWHVSQPAREEEKSVALSDIVEGRQAEEFDGVRGLATFTARENRDLVRLRCQAEAREKRRSICARTRHEPIREERREFTALHELIQRPEARKRDESGCRRFPSAAQERELPRHLRVVTHEASDGVDLARRGILPSDEEHSVDQVHVRSRRYVRFVSSIREVKVLVTSDVQPSGRRS